MKLISVEPSTLKSEFNYYDRIFTELESDRRYFFTHIITGLWFRTDSPKFLYQASPQDMFYMSNTTTNNSFYQIIRKTLLFVIGILNLTYLILFSKQNMVGNTVFFCSASGCEGYSKNSKFIGSNKPIQLSLKPKIYNVKTLEGFANLNLSDLLRAILDSIQHYRCAPRRFDFKAKFSDVFWGCLITKCLVNFIKVSNLKNVYIVGSLNHPACRRIFYVCKLFGVKSTLIIPRTIHKLSIPNLAGVSLSSKGMPSEIFVKNKISLQSLSARVSNIPIKLINTKKNIHTLKSTKKIINDSYLNLLFVLNLNTKENIRLMTLIRDLVDLRRIKYSITIKLHPLDNKKNFYQRYVNFKNYKVRISEDENLINLIKKSDFCILAPSETFNEIIFQKKPIFWYRCLFDITSFDRIYWAYQFGHIIENKEELVKMLMSSAPTEFFELGLKGYDNREWLF